MTRTTNLGGLQELILSEDDDTAIRIDTSCCPLRYSDTAMAIPNSAGVPPASPNLALVSVIARLPRSNS